MTRVALREGENTSTAKALSEGTLVICASASTGKSPVPSQNARRRHLKNAGALPPLMVSVVRNLSARKKAARKEI